MSTNGKALCDPERTHHGFYRLKKTLYGLKQAPRAWNDTLSRFLLSGFSKGDVRSHLVHSQNRQTNSSCDPVTLLWWIANKTGRRHPLWDPRLDQTVVMISTPSEYKWTQTTPSRPSLKWKPTGRIFSNVRLRWVPTGKLFNSCTGKVDSEPTHGSIVDIPHIHACKQTLGLSAGKSFNGQKQQRIDLNADALYNAKQENLRVCSSLVLHQMTSDHNRSELGIQDHNNEQSSSKLVPKVVP
ncbi:hypothetical protein Tco_0079416 [Tanacetum coccineum]